MTGLGSEGVRQHFRDQAAACLELGSPFYHALLSEVAATLTDQTSVGAAILNWPGDPAADALALRFAGGLHALVLNGTCAELTAIYPGGQKSDDPAAYGPTVKRAAAAHQNHLMAYLDVPPQTNEVARAGVLLGGFLTIAAETGLPFRTFEIGASAGVNMYWDQYCYPMPNGELGNSSSTVIIPTEWRSGVLQNTFQAPWPNVIERNACDAAPIDASSPDQRLRLKSYVWPDQADRLKRLEAALDVAASSPEIVEKADAATWLTSVFGPQNGAVSIVYHSIFWQYLAAETRNRIEELIQEAGSKTTTSAPIAWLRMEPDPNGDHAALFLDTWPGHRHRKLGTADYHGRWIDLDFG